MRYSDLRTIEKVLQEKIESLECERTANRSRMKQLENTEDDQELDEYLDLHKKQESMAVELSKIRKALDSLQDAELK